MKELQLNIHSIVEIITNSSTEIYTGLHANALENLKELISLILKSSGSDKEPDDLFEFALTENDYVEERRLDYKAYGDEYKITPSPNNKYWEGGKYSLDNPIYSITMKCKTDDTISYDILEKFQQIIISEECGC